MTRYKEDPALEKVRVAFFEVTRGPTLSKDSKSEFDDQKKNTTTRRQSENFRHEALI